jgi:hypothetical protein
MRSSSESEAVLSGIVEAGSPEQGAADGVVSQGVTLAAGAGAPEEDGEDAVPAADGAVNYDEAGLVEVELDQVLYRLDAGKQGTALCISTRSGDSWRWRFHGEARWDGRTLRSKSFDRRLLDRLSKELQQASSAD